MSDVSTNRLSVLANAVEPNMKKEPLSPVNLKKGMYANNPVQLVQVPQQVPVTSLFPQAMPINFAHYLAAMQQAQFQAAMQLMQAQMPSVQAVNLQQVSPTAAYQTAFFAGEQPKAAKIRGPPSKKRRRCIIEVGVVDKDGTRIKRQYNSLFKKDVAVFTCANSDCKTVLYKSKDLAEFCNVSSSRVSMYLMRKRQKQSKCCDVHQSGNFKNRDKLDLVRKYEYFVSMEACEEFVRKLAH